MVAMENHAVTDLLRKQRPSESLQGYIAYWMEMCHFTMKMDPSYCVVCQKYVQQRNL